MLSLQTTRLLQSVSIGSFEQGCTVGVDAETATFAERVAWSTSTAKVAPLMCGEKIKARPRLSNLQRRKFREVRSNTIRDRAAAPHFLADISTSGCQKIRAKSCVVSRVLIDTRIPGAD